MLCYVMSYYSISYHIVLYHIISYHITSYSAASRPLRASRRDSRREQREECGILGWLSYLWRSGVRTGKGWITQGSGLLSFAHSNAQWSHSFGMVVRSVSAVFRFPFCRLNVLTSRSFFSASCFRFAVLAKAAFQRPCFPFRGPRQVWYHFRNAAKASRGAQTSGSRGRPRGAQVRAYDGRAECWDAGIPCKRPYALPCRHTPYIYIYIYILLFDRLLSTGRLAIPARPVIYLITTTS